ncbi:branched-chain amino acid ABC transporter permease [Petroclostridium sp. X23]|nr:branched-chain amino acid ABC transporter permease [Petroclostridium sp. X23]WHH61742.1 branched-chain amino acid ABC transporter permease [Petroclostridium sp. X23]
MGLNFITGLTGQMNLGTAGIMALGAYTAALMSTNLHAPAWICFVLSIVMGWLIGLGLGYPSLRLKGVYLALTTIGFSEITRLVLTNWVDLTGGTMGVQNIPAITVFGYELDSSFKIYYLYLLVVIVLVFTSQRIVKSKWGRVFKAIRDNVEAVEACGIDIASIKIKAFTLATIFGCLGGAMYTYMMRYVNPTTFIPDLSANYLVMMMLGGIGSVAGNIIGAVIITLLPEFLRFMQSYYWLVFSIITLIFVIFLPNGIISIFSEERRFQPFWIPKTDNTRRLK